MEKSRLTGIELIEPLYKSHGDKSITSLSQVYPGPTVVYLDETIGHLQTNELAMIDEYYDQQYEFFNQSNEDDVLYKVENGREIFRQQHQVETLISKVNFRAGMKILDYGCAKGTVFKRLFIARPDLDPYLFDVSKAYTRLWDQFLPAHKYASYTPKPEWKGSFDVVTSFFAFEHTADPLKELATIKGLLNENGLLYIIVPNVFENVGDFIVADHVHHYSEISLRYMLSKAGFETIEIDTKSHFAAYIVLCRNVAKPVAPFRPDADLMEKVNAECRGISEYWNNIQTKILTFENQLNGQHAAIYGAGVYGNFIAITVQNFKSIKCFVDNNHLLHGQSMLDRPVVKPEDLPSDIRYVYVGLNPKIAKGVIEGNDNLKKNDRFFLYL